MTDLDASEQPRQFRPQFIGQATAVEQARAVAEVQAAVTVAQAVPRRIDEAVRLARESCGQMSLAERAFYRFPRSGDVVTGPSVHLARELKRCFGNMQSGVDELRRDDLAGESEVRAWAWDVQTNAREQRSLIVPHARDTKTGRRKLTELRDITEMIANIGSRAEREVIFALLPTWFVELGVDECRATLERGVTEQSRPVIVANLVDAFDHEHSVTRGQLEDKLGRPAGEWTAADIATLRVIGRALARNETTRELEFPQRRVTASEIAGTDADLRPAHRPAGKPSDPAANASTAGAHGASAAEKGGPAAPIARGRRSAEHPDQEIPS